MDRLQFQGVEFAYAEAPAVLHGLDFTLEAGQLLCLLGPNGGGKSTLLRLAAGLLPPRAGEVRWAGRALIDWSRAERARGIAFLPQTVASVYRHSAREVVALGRHPHTGAWGRLSAEDRAAVSLAMKRTETLDLSARPLDELSGGERQRVLIASALAQGGGLLLLDEPTASLDLHHQITLMTLLRELAEAGRAVICATHDLNLAACFAHRVLLLSEGRLCADGPPAGVLTPDRIREIYGEGVWVGPHPGGDGVAVLPRGGAAAPASPREL